MSNSTNNTEGDYLDYYDYQAATETNIGYKNAEKYIWIIGGVILLAVGTVGNTLALAVLSRPKMRNSNAAVYLMVVAVTDLAALYTGLVRQIIIRSSDLDIREKSEWSCKVHHTLVYFFLDFSAWLLAALSMERLFSVCRPHVVRHRCTRMTSVCIICGIGVVLLAINMHFMFTMGDLTVTFGDMSVTINCITLTEDHYNFISSVWPWVDLSVFSLLPLSVHIVCNCFIVRSVASSFRQARRTGGLGFSATKRSRTSVTSGEQIRSSVTSGEQSRSSVAGSIKGRGRAGVDSTSGDISHSASFNGSTLDPERLNKDRKLSHTSLARKLSHAASVRGRGSMKRDAGENSGTTEIIGTVPNAGEICKLEFVEIAGLADSNESVKKSDQSEVQAKNIESVKQLDDANTKFEKKDSRRKKEQTTETVTQGVSASIGISNTSHNGTTASDTTLTKKLQQKLSTQSAEDRHRSSARRPKSSSEDSRVSSMTIMLLTVSTVFCVTTVPVSLFTIINWILVRQDRDSPYKEVVWAALGILMYTNNAVNFILYSLSGSRFRAEVKAIWRAMCPRAPKPLHFGLRGSSASHSMTSCTDSSGKAVIGRRWSSTTELSSTTSEDRRKSSLASTVVEMNV